VLEARTIHVPDLLDSDEYPEGKEMALRYGHRATLVVPLLRDATAIGAILVRRQEARPFTDKQIELVSNFAKQVLIAIENARLLNELRESLEQQTATSEVLQVISSSLGKLEPVLQSMLGNAMRICDAKFGIMFEYSDGTYRSLSSLAPIIRGIWRLARRAHYISRVDGGGCCRTLATRWRVEAEGESGTCRIAHGPRVAIEVASAVKA
jgi:hypothetical protein